MTPLTATIHLLRCAYLRLRPGRGPGNPGKPAWWRPQCPDGALPFECGSPRLPLKRSRGDRPPVPPLTETARGTPAAKAPQAKARSAAAAGPDPAADSYSAKHLSVLEGLDAVR